MNLNSLIYLTFITFTFQMKHYFQFQKTLLARKSKEIGLNPILGLSLLFLFGVIIPFVIQPITDRVAWGIVFLASIIIFQNIQREKSDFLQMQVGRKQLKIILLLENGLLISPILAFLIIQQRFLSVAIIFFGMIVLSLFPLSQSLSRVIPTPFSKRPFEFASGFRRFLFLYLGLIALFFYSTWIENAHLSLVCIMFFQLMQLGNFTLLEDEIFVWKYAASPREFLWRKMKVAWIQNLYFLMPLSVIQIVIFPETYWLVGSVLLLGLALFSLFIFMKYALFPSELNVVEVIFFACCLFFPPLILVFLPIYYQRAQQNLQTWLKNDSITKS